jgi:hypothetical protein
MDNKDFDIKNGILYNYNSKESHVVIPKRVTKIGRDAFYNCTSLTSIELPNSLTSIGNNAFRNCVNLKSINIPNSVTEIGMAAFYNCINLLDITIPNSVTSIGDDAFNSCRSLMGINIPNSVKKIGNWAFWCCTSLKNIEIPNSMSTIGVGAFCGLPIIKPLYNEKGNLRVFKSFNADWICRGFQYKVGKSYHQDGKIYCCENGFHACTNPLSVFDYYHGELSGIHFAEVELSGEISFAVTCDKVAASDIKIVRELTVQELCDIYNKMKKEK